MGLLAGQVLGKVTLASWPGGGDSTGQMGCSCRGPLVKVTLSVAASASPEICLGCSVVDEISGPEANPHLLRPEQSCVVPMAGQSGGGGRETVGFRVRSPV